MSQIFDNVIFRCDSKEKQQFMCECSKMEIYSSVILRRFVHLFLTDRTVRTAV